MEDESVWIELYNNGMWTDETISMTLPDAVTWLQGFLEKVPEEFRGSSVFEIEYERGYYDSGDSCTVKIGYSRPKTAEEIAREKAQEEQDRAAYAAQQQAREQALYAELKRKYG